MGIYYYLLNDTKRHQVHLDHHIKHGPMTMNEAVHYALINYMMENQSDSMRILSDMYDLPDYTKVDLLKYNFTNPEILENIIKTLNKIHNRERYKIIDGIGIDLEE